eukprot:scaffold15409_cov53-Attheya_sp.AAC.2
MHRFSDEEDPTPTKLPHSHTPMLSKTQVISTAVGYTSKYLAEDQASSGMSCAMQQRRKATVSPYAVIDKWPKSIF